MVSPTTTETLRTQRLHREIHSKYLFAANLEVFRGSFDAVYPGSFDRGLAFTRHAERAEEANGGLEVVDDDANMVHLFDRHLPSLSRANVRASKLTVLNWLFASY